MRKSVAAFALIRRLCAGREEYLTQWNDRWQCYNLVGGHREQGESFHECLLREVSEELKLQPHVDFKSAPEPLAHFDFTAFSESAQQETHFAFEVFCVEAVKPEAIRTIDSNCDNCWLSVSEIQSEVCRDGRRVSETTHRILNELGLLPCHGA